MLRIVLGGLLGGAVVFVWGSISWLALGWHDATIAPLPNEEAVVEVLKAQDLKTTVYLFPMPPAPVEASDITEEQMEASMEAYRKGPIGVLSFQSRGFEPMGPTVMLTGFVIDFIGALIVACLLNATLASRPGYLERVGFVFLVGTFAGFISHFALWNWMNQPLHFTVVMAADIAVAWLLAGLVIAAIVKPNDWVFSNGQWYFIPRGAR